jgi:hypothetical protein
VGEYRQAADTLTRCDRSRNESIPEDLAFPAMARCRLGQRDQAVALLARLRELLQQPNWAGNEEARGLGREAEALIEGKKPGPAK